MVSRHRVCIRREGLLQQKVAAFADDSTTIGAAWCGLCPPKSFEVIVAIRDRDFIVRIAAAQRAPAIPALPA
jgi:hypothetical protein